MKLSDWKLALVILLMVVVDLVILGVYTLVEGVKGNLKAERIKNEEDPEDVIGVSQSLLLLLLLLPFWRVLSIEFMYV